MENPRCSLKLIFSCFDCPYFQNRTNYVEIEKEKYRCMVEKRDFSFNDMSPTGVPKWCPLPFFEMIKNQEGFKQFKEVMKKVEANKFD